MKKLKLIIISLIALLIMPNVANAANGSISVSGPNTVVQGNTATYTVTLSSGTNIGSWQMALNYDNSYLKLTNSSAEEGGTMMVNSSAGGTKKVTYTFTFKTLKSGTTRVSVSSYLAYAYDDMSLMNLSSSNKQTRIMTEQELQASYSKNNNLKNLAVEGFELDKDFNKDIVEYKVDVPTGTKEIKVSATPEDNRSSINGSGALAVTEGINNFEIVVTAQNGDQKTYKLTVNVEDLNPISALVNGQNYVVIKNKELLKIPETFLETTVTINENEIPAFVNHNANITLVGLKDLNGNVGLFIYNNGSYSSFDEMNLKNYLLIPVSFDKELDLIKTTVNINNKTYDAYKYSEKSAFVIINAKSLEDGKTNLYLYDSKNKTAILYDDTYIKESTETIKNYSYIILAFAGALVLMLILIFILLHSLHKKQKKINKFLQKQEAKIEATRKLNDVVNEVKKITVKEQKASSKAKTTEAENIEQPKKSKKELKKEQKAEKKAKLTEQEKNKTPKETEEIKVKEIQTSNPNDEIKKVLSDDEEVYDLFDDEKKKKKKK